MHILKKSSSLIFLVAVGMILSACDTRPSSDGNQSSNEPVIRKIVDWHELSPETTFDTTNDVSITFWHRMGASSQLIIQRWINEFKVLYPNVTVVEEKVATDYNALSSKVALSIASGTEPDIVESYPDHVARYAQAKSPLALNHFINHPVYGLSEEEVADFLPGLWSEGQSYDNAGTILSLPFTKSSEGFFYNKSYFDLHDYDVPTTWAEVFTIAEDIKSREADAIPFGYDSSDNLFITASKQWGAPYTGYNLNTGNGEVQFNNPQSKDMVKFFKDKVDRGLMITRDLNGESFTSDIFKTNQKLYMYVGSTGGTRYAIVVGQKGANFSAPLFPGGGGGGGSFMYNLATSAYIAAIAGGGGGASDVRTINGDLNSRIVVAGGGGGGLLLLLLLWLILLLQLDCRLFAALRRSGGG
jgi:multiple sugar transport system substrate-binding protein